MSENKLVKAYNDMVTYLHEDLGDASKTLARGLEAAREKVSEIGGLTQDEIHKVADFVQRDIEDAAQALAAEEQKTDDEDSLSEWLKFDIQLIENFAIDAFMSVADKTRIELAKLEQAAKVSNIYLSGEITAPGTLICEQCGTAINFKTTSEIPACPKCAGKTYRRS